MFLRALDPPMVKERRPGDYWLKKGEGLITRLRAQYPKHSDRQLMAVLEAIPATQLMPDVGRKDAETTAMVALGMLRYSSAAAPQ